MSRREIPRPPIRHVVEHYGSRITGRGETGWIKVTCCIHDDRNPSAQINEDTDKYRCFTCDFSGDALALIMEKEHVDFPSALRVAEKLLADSGGAVSRNDQPGTSLVPSRQGHRPGRRGWRAPWLSS